MGKSSGTNTVQQSSQPPAQFESALSSLLPQIQQTAATPYQNYTGQIVAPLSGQQIQGQNEIGAAQGAAAPFIQGAAQKIYDSSQPLAAGLLPVNASTIGQYESPYTSDVVKATQAQFANQNAQQASALTNNAVSAGAYGGDRAAVAQGVLGGQQAAAQAPVIAGLENQGYAQALQEANTQQSTALGANEASAWLNSQAGFGLANLGNEALNTSLTGANALINSGGLSQSQQQQELNVPYEQFLAQQAYPFQTQSWQTGEIGNLAAAAGGTGTTSYPGASFGSQALGAGLTAAGIGNLTGAFGSNGYLSSLFSGGSGASGLASLAPSAATTGADLASSGGAGIDWAMLGAADGGDVSALAGGGNVVPFPHMGGMSGITGRHHNDNAPPFPPRMRAIGGVRRFADGGYDDLDQDEADTFSRIHLPVTATLPPRAGATGLAGGPPPAVNLATPPPDYVPSALAGGRGVWEDVPAPEPVAPSRTALPGPSARAPQHGLPTPPSPPKPPEDMPSLLARDADEPAPAKGSGKPSNNADWGKALLYAGLGIMSGRSPQAGVNIGQGGLEGLKLYNAEKEREAQVEGNALYREGMLKIGQQKADTGDQRAQTAALVGNARASELQAQASGMMARAAMAGVAKEPPAIQTAKWLMQQNPDLSREDAINLANGAATRLQIATMNNTTKQSIADRAADLKAHGMSDADAWKRADAEIKERGQDQSLVGGNPNAAPLPRVALPAGAGTAPPLSALEPGKTIHKGYVYQGGDPAQPQSWAPVASPAQPP